MSPEKVEEWFTPGKGPEVKLTRGMKNEGWYDPIKGMKVDLDRANGDMDELAETAAHEITHRTQWIKSKVSPNLELPTEMIGMVKKEMVSKSARGKAEFWAVHELALEVVLPLELPLTIFRGGRLKKVG